MPQYWTGCYTPDGVGGIGVLHLDGSDLVAEAAKAVTPDPSMLLTSPLFTGVMWAVDEGGDAVVTLHPDEDGVLRPRGRVATAGRYPCHLSLTSDGRVLLASCYGDGVVSAHLLDDAGIPGTGTALPNPGSAPVGPHPAQQDGPHAHASLDIDGLVLVADLGTDRVHRYRGAGAALDHEGSFVLPPGSGPRDLLRTPGGRVLVLGEHDCRVHVLDVVRGVIASVPAAEPSLGDQAAAMALIDGRLTVGLRGSNRIAVLRLGPGDIPEAVQAVPCGGDWPRHHVTDRNGILVANERSGTVTWLPWTTNETLGPITTSTPVEAVTYLLRASEDTA